jgi:hypothetical protein
MISALLYLQYHTVLNRTLGRLKRFKDPKYFLWGMVGALYFYFFFFRHFGVGPAQRALHNQGPVTVGASWSEPIGAAVLFIILLLAWIMPRDRASLAFTEAEVAFLFPAPISRQGLIHFKLLRSQTALLFATIFLTLLTNRFGGHPWIRAAGWWLILSTLNLHFIGSSFAITMLLDRGITSWRLRIAIFLLLGGCLAAVIIWARRTLPAIDLKQLEDFDEVGDYFKRLLQSGPVPLLLYPFRLMVRPYLAKDAVTFLAALPAALALLLGHYLWIIRSDVAFEEASVEASRKLAEKVAAIRSGNWQSRKTRKRVRSPFQLRPEGHQSVALLWKNLISASQFFTVRLGIALAAVAVGTCIGLRQTTGSSSMLSVFGMIAGMLMVWSVLFGPQFVRQDFRQDLPLSDLLKSYPMRGWQVVLGEILAPAVILTGFQWILLILAVGLFSGLGGEAGGGIKFNLSVGFGAAILMPLLNMITLQIPNASVLLFPAWFQTGKEAPQGIEATGQRLVFLVGQMLVFVLTLVPAALGFMVVYFMTRFLGLEFLAIPSGSIAAAIILGFEAGLGLMLLGRVFDRLDVSTDLRS